MHQAQDKVNSGMQTAKQCSNCVWKHPQAPLMANSIGRFKAGVLNLPRATESATGP